MYKYSAKLLPPMEKISLSSGSGVPRTITSQNDGSNSIFEICFFWNTIMPTAMVDITKR